MAFNIFSTARFSRRVLTWRNYVARFAYRREKHASEINCLTVASSKSSSASPHHMAWILIKGWRSLGMRSLISILYACFGVKGCFDAIETWLVVSASSRIERHLSMRRQKYSRYFFHGARARGPAFLAAASWAVCFIPSAFSNALRDIYSTSFQLEGGSIGPPHFHLRL